MFEEMFQVSKTAANSLLDSFSAGANGMMDATCEQRSNEQKDWCFSHIVCGV
jgi:hypothetical protein